MESVIAGTCAIAIADADGSATEVAVMFTVKSASGGAGAVYVVFPLLNVNVGDTLPHGTGEQDKLQVTPLLAGSLLTVAVSCAVPPGGTVAKSVCPTPFDPKPIPTTIPEGDIGGGGGGGGVLAEPPPQPIWLTARKTQNSIPKSAMRFFEVMMSFLSGLVFFASKSP